MKEQYQRKASMPMMLLWYIKDNAQAIQYRLFQVWFLACWPKGYLLELRSVFKPEEKEKFIEARLNRLYLATAEDTSI